MKRSAAVIAFLHSPEGSGWGAILLFATLLAGFAGYAFYLAMLWSFVESKTAEKGAALQLVDAFVSEYSNLRKELGADRAPVPATFRAHSIELFNQARDSENTLRLRWVGRQGLAIATPPLDRPMADMIESFVASRTRCRLRYFLRLVVRKSSERSILRSREIKAASIVTTKFSRSSLGSSTT